MRPTVMFRPHGLSILTRPPLTAQAFFHDGAIYHLDLIHAPYVSYGAIYHLGLIHAPCVSYWLNGLT